MAGIINNNNIPEQSDYHTHTSTRARTQLCLVVVLKHLLKHKTYRTRPREDPLYSKDLRNHLCPVSRYTYVRFHGKVTPTMSGMPVKKLEQCLSNYVRFHVNILDTCDCFL